MTHLPSSRWNLSVAHLSRSCAHKSPCPGLVQYAVGRTHRASSELGPWPCLLQRLPPTDHVHRNSPRVIQQLSAGSMGSRKAPVRETSTTAYGELKIQGSAFGRSVPKALRVQGLCWTQSSSGNAEPMVLYRRLHGDDAAAETGPDQQAQAQIPFTSSVSVSDKQHVPGDQATCSS